MSYYTVNGTKTVAAWVSVEADSEEEALAAAREIRATDWEHDDGTAEIDMDVTPAVELDS